MIYFDRQMQRIQEAFEQLDTQVYFPFSFSIISKKVSGPEIPVQKFRIRGPRTVERAFS